MRAALQRNMVDEKQDMSQQYPWLHRKRDGQQGKGGHCPPLCVPTALAVWITMISYTCNSKECQPALTIFSLVFSQWIEIVNFSLIKGV